MVNTSSRKERNDRSRGVSCNPSDRVGARGNRSSARKIEGRVREAGHRRGLLPMRAVFCARDGALYLVTVSDAEAPAEAQTPALVDARPPGRAWALEHLDN